jgi:hypothetical protein
MKQVKFKLPLRTMALAGGLFPFCCDFRTVKYCQGFR